MRKWITGTLALMCCAGLMTGCAAKAEERTGTAQGYGGPLTVVVDVREGDILSVEVTSHQETPGIGTRAIETLPDLIVQADSADVDVVSGATYTSRAILSAVTLALGDQGPIVYSEAPIEPQTSPEPAMSGVGMAATGRLGPGTQEDGTPVYSFNAVFASADFDSEGRILALDVDQLEVLSSQFTGFPEEKEAEADFLAQVSQWTTKRAKGDDYMLGSGSWRRQMDAYEEMMTGKTIDEINEWFSANFSTETGKPVENTDAVTGATMSLRDEHGDILTAIQRAWEDAQQQTGTPATAAPATGAPAPANESPMNDTNILNDPADGGESYG